MRIYLFLFALTLSNLYGQQILNEADLLLISGENEKVVALADKNLESATGDLKYLLLNKKASALTRLGQLDLAESVLKSLESSNLSGKVKAVTLSTLGFNYLNRGRNDLALDALKNSLDYFQKEGASTTLDAAQAMNYLGLVYKSTGKESQAEEQLQMALSIREKLLPPQHELIAASYNDLGFAFAQRDNDKSLDYYEKALKIYTTLHGEQNAKIAIANTNLGFTYRELTLYGDAVNYLETALKIYEALSPKPNPSKAFVLFNLGKTYFQMGNTKAAREYYEKALVMYRQSYGEKHPDIATVLQTKGTLEIGAQKFDEALQYYQLSLQANVIDFSSDDIATNPKNQNFYNGTVLLYTLLRKAQALESRHFGKTLKFSDLKLSLSTLQHCDSLIDILRQQITNESDKIALGTIANEVYADGVRISHEAAQQALKKNDYRKLAFYFAEKSKSAVLLEAISESEAKSFAGIPPTLLDDEKELKSNIALTSQKLAQKPSSEEEKILREKLFGMNRSFETFVSRLEKEFPDYYNLKFSSTLPTVEQLQKIIDPASALLSYFVDDKNARIYIFKITSRSFSIVDHPMPKDFDKIITGLRNGLFFNVLKPYARSASTLYKLLIPKQASRIKNLVIIPTGRLSIVPFETLLSGNVSEADSYNNLPYLVKRFSVQYEFAAGLMIQKSKQQRTSKSSILLCAPINFPVKDNLNDLPATESEVTEIAQLFSAKNIGSTLYTRGKANEQAIKTHSLIGYDVLHFATHGIVDETSPELSRIYLQNDSEKEDGNLFSGEIYNLKMDANLVTLSACQTGLGKISKGEGVIGLSRALVYAGARNLIVSFWSVADESTSQLMKTFYQQMLNNPSQGFSKDLREAKLALMKSSNYSSPYYWAPFILIGY
jgi:CHAT domain-containing protein/Tfp pilus assembly protein PilF